MFQSVLVGRQKYVYNRKDNSSHLGSKFFPSKASLSGTLKPGQIFRCSPERYVGLMCQRHGESLLLTVYILIFRAVCFVL